MALSSREGKTWESELRKLYTDYDKIPDRERHRRLDTIKKEFSVTEEQLEDLWFDWRARMWS